MKLSLNHRVATRLLQLYYGLLEMEDYPEKYEFIYSEDTRDEELTYDQIVNIVDEYLDDLKAIIDEFYEEISKK